MQLSKEERERGGMWDMDTKVASTITSHDAGYLDKDLEKLLVFKLKTIQTFYATIRWYSYGKSSM